MQVTVIIGIISTLKTLEYTDCCECPHVGMMVDGFMAVEIFSKKRVDCIIGRMYKT
jgi:hypothetical protein